MEEDNNIWRRLRFRGQYFPFLDRETESKSSFIIKYLMNFLITIIQIVVNIPLFLIALGALTPLLDPLFGIDYTKIKNFLIDNIIPISLIVILLYILHILTIKNMVSKDVNLIWAINFYGRIRNRFYSHQKSVNEINTLNDLVMRQADERVSFAVQEYESMLDELKDIIKRYENTEYYSAFLASYDRIIDLMIGKELLDDSSPNIEYFLSQTLAEICTFIPEANQGTIFLVKENEMVCSGSINTRESSLRGRKYKVGEGFTGIVAEKADIVWVLDINHPDAEVYGFIDNSRKTYKGILGYPITHRGLVIGVINVMFGNTVAFTDTEISNLNSLLKVYGQLILLFLVAYNVHEGVYKDIILSIDKTKEGENEDE